MHEEKNVSWEVHTGILMLKNKCKKVFFDLANFFASIYLFTCSLPLFMYTFITYAFTQFNRTHLTILREALLQTIQLTKPSQVP